jgi:hypothetical protein
VTEEMDGNGHRLPLLSESWTAAGNEQIGGTNGGDSACTCRSAASGPGSRILFCKR